MNSHIRYAHIRIWMGYLHPIMFYTKLLARMNRNNIIAWLSSNMTSALILFCGKIVGRVNYLWDRVIISLYSFWYHILSCSMKIDIEMTLFLTYVIKYKTFLQYSYLKIILPIPFFNVTTLVITSINDINKTIIMIIIFILHQKVFWDYKQGLRKHLLAWDLRK